MITVACCMFDVTVSIYTNHVFCLLTCLPGYLSLYVVYVLTVIISAYIYNRQKYSVSADSLNEPQIPGQSYPKYKSLKKRIDKHQYLFCCSCYTDVHSSDSSDDDVPCLNPESIQQDYGTVGQFMCMCNRVFIFIIHSGLKSYICVLLFQNQSTGHFFHTQSPPVTSC